MKPIISATCPRCGAGLDPAPGQEQVVCRYCGTTSLVRRAAQPVAPTTPSSKPRALAGFIGVATLALLATAGTASYLLLAPASQPPVRSPELTPGVQMAVTPEPAVAVAPGVDSALQAPNGALTFKVNGEFRPLLANVNPGQSPDILTQIEVERVRHYAVFAATDGKELARTPALTERDQALAAVVGRRLISASGVGQLTSYGLANGTQQWTTALGERPGAFCRAKTEEELLVVTDDGRQLHIDLTTGRQSETKERCAVRLTPPGRSENPRDRFDYSAPAGVEGYRCGGVTVMGSQNYTVADQCLVRARVDTDRLDGFVGHRLWKMERDWLAFGVRNPGTHVPMIGRVSRGKLSWKQNVPRDNPLEVETGSPRHAGLAQDLVVVAYANAKERSQFVTAFAVADGARRWHVALPQDLTNVTNLVTSSDRVFVQGREQLLLLSSADGKLVARVGASEATR